MNKTDYHKRVRAPGCVPLHLYLLLLACFFLLQGCATAPSSSVTLEVHPDFYSIAPRSIAVLPFDNMSTDLDATPLVRPIVARRLAYKGYVVPNIKATDKILQEEGVMVSHDVYSFTAQELGQFLNVDAVMFGTVTDFTTKYAVVYASVAVQLRLELVDTRTGEIIWQNEQRAAQNTAFETILTLVAYHEDIEEGLVVVAVQNAAFAILESYRPYGEEAARMTLAPLPPGHLTQSLYPWDQDPEAFKNNSAKSMIYESPITTSPR